MQPRKTVAALAFAAAFAAGAAATYYAGQPAHARRDARQAPLRRPGRAPRAALPDFASIAQQYGPAVVNIAVSGTRKTGMRGGAGRRGQSAVAVLPRHAVPLRPAAFRGARRRARARASSSAPTASILTNAHVVQGATEVTVKLTDRREFRAKVLGSDPATDIAVLRIDAKDLPVVKLGDPARTRVGDWVVAIGSPFGFENSVSAGIVSAKGRSLPGDAYVPFIQTDVAVNPGNSGGPLFNLAGEVIGINSQIYSRSGGYQGLSFAIPIERRAQGQGPDRGDRARLARAPRRLACRS